MEHIVNVGVLYLCISEIQLMKEKQQREVCCFVWQQSYV